MWGLKEREREIWVWGSRSRSASGGCRWVGILHWRWSFIDLFIYILFLLSIRVCNVKRDTLRRTGQNDRNYPQQISVSFLCFERGHTVLRGFFPRNWMNSLRELVKSAAVQRSAFSLVSASAFIQLLKPWMNGVAFKGACKYIVPPDSQPVFTESVILHWNVIISLSGKKSYSYLNC